MFQTVVYKEHTLGLVFEENVMQILSSSVINGSDDICGEDGCIQFEDNEVRMATLKDFESFRVQYHTDYIVA